jgi:hypothetical protein
VGNNAIVYGDYLGLFLYMITLDPMIDDRGHSIMYSLPPPPQQNPEVIKRLESLNCLLTELLGFIPTIVPESPKMAVDISKWNATVPYHAEYYMKNYSSVDNWSFPRGLFEGGAVNYPWGKPKIDIDFFFAQGDYYKYDKDPHLILEALLHEPQHDFSQQFLFYHYPGDADYLSKGISAGFGLAIKLEIPEYCCIVPPNEGMMVKNKLIITVLGEELQPKRRRLVGFHCESASGLESTPSVTLEPFASFRFQ